MRLCKLDNDIQKQLTVVFFKQFYLFLYLVWEPFALGPGAHAPQYIKKQKQLCI